MIRLTRKLLLAALLVPFGAASQELAPKPFQSGSVVLLQPDSEMGERLGGDVEGLVSYMKGLFATLEEEVGRHPSGEPTSGVLVVAVRPKGRSRVWLEFGSNPRSESLVATLREKLQAVQPPLVWSGPISFSVELEFWGGGSPLTSPEQPVFMPLEWREAIGRMGRPADTETVLDAVWPDES